MQTLNPAGLTPARDLCFTVPSYVDEFNGTVGSHILESLCQDASINTRASRCVLIICSELDLQIPRIRTAIGLTATMAYRTT